MPQSRGARAPVEDYMKTPEFKQFQSKLQRLHKIQRLLESRMLQKIAQVKPFQQALQFNKQKVQELMKSMPKPVEELHQQPDSMNFEGTQVTY